MNFNNIKQDLKFELTEKELLELNLELSEIKKEFKLIQEFDLSKYKQYLNDDEDYLEEIIMFDDTDEFIELNKENIFFDSINFENNYVKVKNDK